MKEKIILIAIEGWSENGAEWNYSLLREELKSLPIKIVVPSYLDAKGKFSRFRSHRTVEEYASKVEKVILAERRENPNAKIYVLGHSLGGVIARYLCSKNFLPEEYMILAGTPNLGINFGFLKNSILKILAKICNVPAFFQLLEGSKFIYTLNIFGIPSKAHYIFGEEDSVVSRASSDPLKIGISVPNCGHKLFPREKEKLESSAIPVIKRILEKGLENK